VGITVIFYSVPEDNPLAPPTVFVDRWWDYRDGWLRDGVGTDNKWRIFRGPIPSIPVEPYEGTPEQWIKGLSYETYLAGGYANRGPCVPIPPLTITPVLPCFASAPTIAEAGWNDFPILEVSARGLASTYDVWEDSPIAPCAAVCDPAGGSVGEVDCLTSARELEGEPINPVICLTSARELEGEPLNPVDALASAQCIDVT